MNAAILLMTSAWLAGADAAPAAAAPAAGCCTYPTCDACCHVKPTCYQRLRAWCESLGHKDCCDTCDTCCAPKPTCCPAPKCCPAPTCCPAPKCCPAPTCCPAPKCCDTCCDTCDKGCGGGLLKRLFHHKDDCCDACDTCGTAAPAKAEPIGAPKEQPKKMPEGASIPPALDSTPVVVPSDSRIPF